MKTKLIGVDLGGGGAVGPRAPSNRETSMYSLVIDTISPNILIPPNIFDNLTPVTPMRLRQRCP